MSSSVATPCPVCASPNGVRSARLDFYDVVRCTGCRLERLLPAPTDATLEQIYSSGYYDAWAGDEMGRSVKRATYRALLRSAPLRNVALPTGATILDCGAGPGHFMEMVAERGYQAFGVERSSAAAEALRRRFSATQIFTGSFEDEAVEAHFSGTPMDAVFMLDFIEHVRDPRAALTRAARLLGPNGVLVLTTPDTDSLSRRLLGRRWPHFKVEHLHYFDLRNLTRLLIDSGFRLQLHGRAWKRLSVDYVAAQLCAYEIPLVTPMVSAVRRLAWTTLRQRPLPVTLGEMLVTARRA